MTRTRFCNVGDTSERVQNARPSRTKTAPPCRAAPGSCAPRRAGGERQRQRAAEHDVERQLAAERAAHRGAIEIVVPGMAACRRTPRHGWCGGRTATCRRRAAAGRAGSGSPGSTTAACRSIRSSESKPRSSPIASRPKSKPPNCGPLPAALKSRRTRIVAMRRRAGDAGRNDRVPRERPGDSRAASAAPSSSPSAPPTPRASSEITLTAAPSSALIE